MAFYDGMADLYGGDNEDEELRERRLMLEQMGQEPGVSTQDRVMSSGMTSGPMATTGQGIDERYTPPPTSTSGPSSGFQSVNASPAGYAQEYLRSVIDQIRAVPVVGTDETARKAKAQELIQAMLPELKARGLNVQDVRNEKILVDGKWIDLIRDVSGVADPQWLPLDEGGGQRPSGYYGPNSTPNANAVGASLVPDDWDTYQKMQARLQELLGGAGTFDREALMRQMTR